MAQFDDPVMNLPHAYYVAIGEFMFRFAQLEYQLHEIVWMALDVAYKRGRILTIGTDVRVQCGMVNAITSTTLWIKNKTRIQEMNSICANLRKHIGLRNSIAHGSWQAPRGESKMARLHFMKETPERILPRVDSSLDDRKIHRVTGELKTLNVRAQKLIAQLNAERPSSLQKSP